MHHRQKCHVSRSPLRLRDANLLALSMRILPKLASTIGRTIDLRGGSSMKQNAQKCQASSFRYTIVYRNPARHSAPSPKPNFQLTDASTVDAAFPEPPEPPEPPDPPEVAAAPLDAAVAKLKVALPGFSVIAVPVATADVPPSTLVATTLPVAAPVRLYGIEIAVGIADTVAAACEMPMEPDGKFTMFASSSVWLYLACASEIWRLSWSYTT